ncbi:MAG: ATP-binding protein [Geobacteraceae bacterium]|nr:ATP-binding protein [Geobacteraceae bacterium]
MKTADNSIKEFYANVIDSVGDGVIVLDMKQRITLMNPAAEEITGVSISQAEGSDFSMFFGKEEALAEMVSKTSANGMIISDHENIVLKKGSHLTPVNVTTSPLILADGEQIGTVLVLRDISNIRELEDAVRHADRLSTLGTLAAGLAHEIKNPLGGIKGAAQLLERELPGGSGLHDYTSIILREVGRVNKIVEELLSISTPRKLEFGHVNLQQILGEIVILQKNVSRTKSVIFQQNFDLSIPPVIADGALLTQLFLNLVTNAVEAVVSEGLIRITTRVVSDYGMSKKGVRLPRLSRMVAVDIADNGTGMTREQMENIFTPFFTTKTKGTGLGLAICHKIVSEHRGMIKVDSESGKGTTFTVLLPMLH